MLGESLTHIELIKSCILRSEVEAQQTPRGAFDPAFWPLHTVRVLLPFAYPKAIETLQTIGAGGLLMMPSAADFDSPIAGDANKLYRGAAMSSVDRTRINKVAWDLAGEAFGSRALQYERYYAGDPMRNLANFYVNYDKSDCERLVERALKIAGDPVASTRAEERRLAAQ
jgi:anthranilate 3-monooxygenase (FAD)/4-hydroxyphenylacetate 3-monooxygenase